MSASSAFHDTFGRAAFGDYGRTGGAASVAPQGSLGKQGPLSQRGSLSKRGALTRHGQTGDASAAGRGQRVKEAPLRLTRRGRFVFIGVPLILLAALILSFSGFLNAPAKAAESAAGLSLTPTVTVTVQPGESLWAIAESVAPERDPRDVVTDIIQLNNLEAARVVPGQALFIPSK
jgi:LysM repeat protein